MPTAKNAPKSLNDLLEKVYSNCLKEKAGTTADKTSCSKIAWDVAKKTWTQSPDGTWHKKPQTRTIY